MEPLEVRRTIGATPERLFEAWTEPAQLLAWWGPPGVACIDARVDLRVGGTYRIANRLPDGHVLWISGEFVVIDRPRKLVFTWSLEPAAAVSELVTVDFEQRGKGTEVVVRHERIPDEPTRDQHRQGWDGCLDGLDHYMQRTSG
jgi:uncharacterized protein YndB with AHSA1/START domain